MDTARIIFESYNKAVEESYNDAFAEKEIKDPLKLKETDIKPYLNKHLGKWADRPLAELEGVTPRTYFESLTDFNNVLEHFKLGARICDEGLPWLLEDRIMSFGNGAVEALFELASDKHMLENEQDFYIPLAAIRMLGERRLAKAAGFLIKLMDKLDDNKEIIVEQITDALINIGIPCIGLIIERLNNLSEIGYLDEYILTVLVKVGKDNKSDEIYRCIKNTFLKMEDKVLGAMCVGDYGDGRAVPALKGFVEKNREKIDKQTYQEIKAAVRRLGGSIDDMNKKFQDS